MSLRTLATDPDALAHCRAVNHFRHIQSICPGGATHFYPGASAVTLICLSINSPQPTAPTTCPYLCRRGRGLSSSRTSSSPLGSQFSLGWACGGELVGGRCQDEWLKTQERMGAAQELGWTKDGWSCSPALNLGVPPKSSVGTGAQWCDPTMPRPLLSLPANFPCRAQKGRHHEEVSSEHSGRMVPSSQAGIESTTDSHLLAAVCSRLWQKVFYSNFYVLVFARSSVFHLVGGWEWESSWVLHSHPLFIQLHPSCPHVSSQSNLSAITWAALCVILSGNTLRH